MAKKSTDDSKRNSHVHQLVYKWVELNRPDVMKACRAAGEKKYPKLGKSKSPAELTDELRKLTAYKPSEDESEGKDEE
jgi:hypothetical protein